MGLGLPLVLALLATSAAAPDDPLREQRGTVEAIRSTGMAMVLYVGAQTLAGNPPSPAAQPGTSDATDPATRFDWSACPSVSYDQAVTLLGPYVEPERLPRVDGWGHAMELCVRQEGSGPVVGIRSPGRDGRFEGAAYEVGPFEPTDFDRDLVWLDGYFVRWPQRQ
jgi:hypothetical protein